MGGRYEVIGWYYPYKGLYDFHKFTNNWFVAQFWRITCRIKYKNVTYTIRGKNKRNRMG